VESAKQSTLIFKSIASLEQASRPISMKHIINRYAASQFLVSSIKVEVKKKHFCIGRTFSCFAAHLDEQDVF